MRQWPILLCLLLFACSCSTFIAERPVDDAYVVVMEISDKGLIEREIDKVKLPYSVTGKADMVVRDNSLYIGSYERLHILEHDASGVLQLTASLPVPGHNTLLALHPKEPVLYMTNSRGLFVVDVKDTKDPRLASHLLFSIELRKIWGGEWSDGFVGVDLACESDRLVVAIQDIVTNPADTTIIFDVSQPLTPQPERTLNTPPNTSAVAMGLVDHQMFAVGDRMVEYRNFEPDSKQQMYDGSWLRRPSASGNSTHIMVPGDVVEMKFLISPFRYMEMGTEKFIFPNWRGIKDHMEPSWHEVSFEKLQEIIDQYRHGSSEERQQLLAWMPLDHGVLYIATEHALTFYNTRNKMLFWKLKPSRKYNLSDYFGHLYGMDTRGHEQAYLAAGKDGVYVIDLLWDTRHRFVTRECYRDLPASALDVCVANNKLYILCGELDMQNIQHNEWLSRHRY